METTGRNPTLKPVDVLFCRKFGSNSGNCDFRGFMTGQTPAIKRIAIIGPECTGKSVLSEYLAKTFSTKWVPEYARQYLDELQREYNESDLLKIARGQLMLEDQLSKAANNVLFCDTNLIVIKVWSEYKYGRVAPEIMELIKQRIYDLYLLTYIDIPWEFDPLREHPEKRDELFEIYQREMENQTVPYAIVRGDSKFRQDMAVTAVKSILVR